MDVHYSAPGQLGTKGTTTIGTSETILLSLTDGNFVKKSQLTFYFDVTLGSATKVTVRYYMTPDFGTTWFEVPAKSSSGQLQDIGSLLDSTSPAQSTNIRVIEDIGFSGSTGVKITAQATGATATLNNLYIYGRDN